MKSWDRFYKRNAANFFKDRHYLANEFSDLTQQLTLDSDAAAAAPFTSSSASSSSSSSSPRHLLEVGCGVGNALFPLQSSFPALHLHGCDASKNAIGLIHQRVAAEAKEQQQQEGGTATSTSSPPSCPSPPLDVWVQDIVTEPFPPHLAHRMHYCTLIFVLSAIDPTHHATVLRSIRAQLQPNTGVLYLRDYARLDHSQLRFASSSLLKTDFYLRADGTRSYFFELPALVRLMNECGYEVVSGEVVERRVENRKEKLDMRRRFVQLRARAAARAAAAE